MQNSTRWLLTDLSHKPACRQLKKLHPPSPFIVVQLKSWSSFSHPLEGRTLKSSWMAGYIPRRFTCLQAVTYLSSNWARCWLTTLIEASMLTTTPSHHLWHSLCCFTHPPPLGGADAYMFYSVFFFFRPPWYCINMRQPFSGTAERIFMKLLPNDSRENGVSITIPKWGLGPQIIFGG